MGSVCSSSALNCSLGGSMSDLALFDIKTLGFSVGSEVLEETNNVIDRFLWESSLSVVDLFAQCLSADTIVE